eukprot:762921-Hanusia_phi.AAC.2
MPRAWPGRSSPPPSVARRYAAPASSAMSTIRWRLARRASAFFCPAGRLQSSAPMSCRILAAVMAASPQVASASSAAQSLPATASASAGDSAAWAASAGTARRLDSRTAWSSPRIAAWWPVMRSPR